MTDLYEITVKPSRQPARWLPSLPVMASMTFTRDDRTLLGDDPVKVACRSSEAGADVIGVNCSGGPNQILRILKQMRQAIPEGAFFGHAQRRVAGTGGRAGSCTRPRRIISVNMPWLSGRPAPV